MTACSSCLSPKTANEIEEACHHKHLLNLFVDIDDYYLASLGLSFLTDGEEEAQTRTADVFQVFAVEGNLLVGIVEQRSNLLLSLDS